MRFIEIAEDNIELLCDFVNSLGGSRESFRYYEKREPLEAIRNHETTLLLVDETALGYGHLDKEDGKVWLGICIAAAHQGEGLGKLIMKELIRRSGCTINLSVDKNNKSAIKLYERFDFIIVKEEPTYYLMEKKV
jgi:ribosomal protein S18 acetylase RimI-like enzyme